MKYDYSHEVCDYYCETCGQAKPGCAVRWDYKTHRSGEFPVCLDCGEECEYLGEGGGNARELAQKGGAE